MRNKMNKDKTLDTITTIVVLIWMVLVGIGFQRMNNRHKELIDQVIKLKDQNSEITKQVEKLNKTIDSINAKRLKEVAEKNNVGG